MRWGLEGHKFISLGYYVLPSFINKGFIIIIMGGFGIDRYITLLAELYNGVNELINSKYLIRLARQISGRLIKI